MSDREGNTEPPSGIASARLMELLEFARAKGRLSVDEALEAMGTAGTAFAILFLAIPALTPMPGPFGMVFGRHCKALMLASDQFHIDPAASSAFQNADGYRVEFLTSNRGWRAWRSR